MITAALNGELDNIEFRSHEVFGLEMPTSCPNVPDEMLNPRDTWADKAEYDNTANILAEKFVNNFKQFEEQASEAIMAAAPKVIA
jgi:phosphoenolpyruvate carboxykinase (ATP)